MREIFLDIIGVSLVVISVIAFKDQLITFEQGSIIGVAGLSLFILKSSQIRKIILKIIDKFTK